MVEKLDSDNLNKNLANMEDWYRAVIFDTSCNVIAKKGIENVDDKELK